MHDAAYVGRFAPSPSGPLHAGSLVAAMASFLDARAHGGRWLVRIEDIDRARTSPGADQFILHQLRALGMSWSEPPVWQTTHLAHYAQAFERLHAAGRLYPCICSRQALPVGPYPGTCRPRHGLPVARVDTGHPGSTRKRAAWRFIIEPGLEHFDDRWFGPQTQDVSATVGDFIVRRADGVWAYQLAVVVDDAAQGVTHVVRGTDLLDSTARQRQLARALGVPRPIVLHVPLVCDAAGRKLSKQNHASALDISHPLRCLRNAWLALGFEPITATTSARFWARATEQWARRFAALNTRTN